MYRIDNQLGATVLPAPTAPSITPDLFFTAGDEIAGVQATIVDAEWLNMVQEEICYVITANGMALNKADRTQLRQAIAYMTGQDLSGYLPIAGGTLTGNLYVETAIYTVGDIGSNAGNISAGANVTAVGNVSGANVYAAGTVSAPIIYGSTDVTAAGSVTGAYLHSTAYAQIDASLAVGETIRSSGGRIVSENYTSPSFALHLVGALAAGIWVDPADRLYFGQTDGSGNAIQMWAYASAAQIGANGGFAPGLAYGANNAVFFADADGGYIRFSGLYPNYHQLGYSAGAGLLSYNTPQFPGGGGAWSCDSVGNTIQAGNLSVLGNCYINYPSTGTGTIVLGNGGSTVGGSWDAVFFNAGGNSVTLAPIGFAIQVGDVWVNTGRIIVEHQVSLQPGGGAWGDYSDARIKHDIVPYAAGLDEVLQLRPKVYSFVPETGRDPDVRYIGLISQDVQPIMPETVRQRVTVAPRLGTITIDDLLEFNGTAVIYALVNAVQALAGRLAALEGARA
jgi:hypothetical protein